MKHLLIITMALLSINTFAQVKTSEIRKIEREKFTPEQIAELQTKRMTLDLDLDESQKERIYQLNLKEATERQKNKKRFRVERQKEMKQLSAEERFKLKNERLDKALARKQEMKTILSDAQFSKWEVKRKHRGSKARASRRGLIKQRKHRNKNGRKPHVKKETN